MNFLTLTSITEILYQCGHTQIPILKPLHVRWHGEGTDYLSTPSLLMDKAEHRLTDDRRICSGRHISPHVSPVIVADVRWIMPTIFTQLFQTIGHGVALDRELMSETGAS